jgi:hypothetical protein
MILYYVPSLSTLLGWTSLLHFDNLRERRSKGSSSIIKGYFNRDTTTYWDLIEVSISLQNVWVDVFFDLIRRSIVYQVIIMFILVKIGHSIKLKFIIRSTLLLWS